MRAEAYVNGTLTRIEGPLLFLRRNMDVGLDEAVTVYGADGEPRLGRIAALDEDVMTVEVLEETGGLALADTRVRLTGAPVDFGVGPDLLGRIFDGLGRVADDGPPVAARQRRPVDGDPLNPAARDVPRDFIETGITTIDLLNSLVRGQKLPFFSGGGLPHDRLAVRIAEGARLRGDEPFAVVFCGIGIPSHTAAAFRRAMEEGGARERTVMFLNQASDSSTQRLLTPRFALTAAEYLAFEEGWHVLVVMTDMTNYCEALREVSASHGEIPSRKGYPGYMYSDLAALYERAGALRGQEGSLTQLPILTMPSDDITHPIPDLTGYITEGQMVLDRELDRRGLEPPVKVLPSLSRLMKDGTGTGYTDPDHGDLASQLYAAYARVHQIRVLASVVGEESLPATDRTYLRFGERFEAELVNQPERRTLEESMAVGWRLLAMLPHAELHRLSDAQIRDHLGDGDEGGGEEENDGGT
ncbi:V/A-type H+-transporting ATPase subunit B [Thiohalospira halophila DSM 15071]|uniref:V-type ATP synthase beta chain n=1 Tax=Thiohalospira halophila DSM 15071 TaxID=1123397 RepID=A0A1I1NK13_9GAMM|nr:V-type ATP synthase subunit B [Thiohalospira halophila]SFC97766.1 V/A-type H+-transporting ATPase subunit B [Thiohalospira halophila DSM 15071]